MMFGLVLCSVLLMSLVDVNEATYTGICNADGNNDLILSDGVFANMEAALANSTFENQVVSCMSTAEDCTDCTYCTYGIKINACLCEYLANGCQCPVPSPCTDAQQEEYAAIQGHMKNNH